jgi:hypothetical protein
MVVQTRMGTDPGPERFDNAIAAVRVIFEQLDDATTIDRSLAYSLYSLANYVEPQLTSWSERGKQCRPRLLDYELPSLLLAVESVFAGEWLGEDDDGEEQD